MKTYLKYILISLVVLYFLVASYSKIREGSDLLFQDIHQSVIDHISR